VPHAGGRFDLPHAETHAIVLPHAIAYNAWAVPDLLAPLADLFGGGEPGQALHRFARAHGAPLALRDLGLAETALDTVVDIALAKPYPNPRPLERVALRALLQAAWRGHADGLNAPTL
jgi:maleylacetate reductase